MPKFAIVSLLLGGLLATALAGTAVMAEPNPDTAVATEHRVNPKTKAWFDRTIEHMLDESSSVADAGASAR